MRADDYQMPFAMTVQLSFENQNLMGLNRISRVTGAFLPYWLHIANRAALLFFVIIPQHGAKVHERWYQV